jgi:hypothetical protein
MIKSKELINNCAHVSIMWKLHKSKLRLSRLRLSNSSTEIQDISNLNQTSKLRQRKQMNSNNTWD